MEEEVEELEELEEPGREPEEIEEPRNLELEIMMCRGQKEVVKMGSWLDFKTLVLVVFCFS